jgi:hypothetical protein
LSVAWAGNKRLRRYKGRSAEAVFNGNAGWL